MSFKPHVVKTGQVRAMNAREQNRLDLRIRGHAGLEEQKRYKTQQNDQECDLVRRELAEMYFSARGQKITRKEKAKINSVFEEDTSLLMMREREKRRKTKNRRMLYRAKQKDKLMEDMVKDFITKLDNESNSKQPPSKPLEKIKDDQNPSQKKTLDPVKCELTEESPPIFRSTSYIWESAKNTRFVRTKILRDFEIELNLNEIFGNAKEL